MLCASNNNVKFSSSGCSGMGSFIRWINMRGSRQNLGVECHTASECTSS